MSYQLVTSTAIITAAITTATIYMIHRSTLTQKIKPNPDPTAEPKSTTEPTSPQEPIPESAFITTMTVSAQRALDVYKDQCTRQRHMAKPIVAVKPITRPLPIKKRRKQYTFSNLTRLDPDTNLPYHSGQ